MFWWQSRLPLLHSSICNHDSVTSGLIRISFQLSINTRHMFVAIVIGFVCIHRAGRRFYDLSPIPNLSAIPLRSESYHNTGDHLP